MNIGDISSLVGAVAGLAAIIFAWVTLRRTNKIGSASALLAFYQSSSQGWEKVIQQHQANANITHSVAELLNTLELGACLYEENVFTGEMRDVLGKYIRDCMKTIDGVNAIRSIKSSLMTGDPLAFKFLIKMQFSVD